MCCAMRRARYGREHRRSCRPHPSKDEERKRTVGYFRVGVGDSSICLCGWSSARVRNGACKEGCYRPGKKKANNRHYTNHTAAVVRSTPDTKRWHQQQKRQTNAQPANNTKRVHRGRDKRQRQRQRQRKERAGAAGGGDVTHIFLFLPKWATSVNRGISVPDPTKIRMAYGAAFGIGGAFTFLLHATYFPPHEHMRTNNSGI